MKITATIITFNEEKNIERAIHSVNFCDEVVVIDSYSSDRTVDIARKLGAKVIFQAFLGYGQQKNFAAEQSSNDWILSIDADEEISDELAREIKKLSLDPSTVYRFQRRTQFCGKWIYHGGWYPDILSRLYHREKASWSSPHVHEELSGEFISNFHRLGGHLNHYSFPSVDSQIETNLKYAKLGAKKLKDPFFVTMLIRPFWKFLECFLLKGGILDGKEGLVIAINAAHSQFMKYSFAYYSQKNKELDQ